MHPTRIFKEPKDLLQAWEEYKEHLKIEAWQWTKVQYAGKDAERKEDPFKLPYTMDGFSVFCFNKYGTVKHYFDNKENYYTDFGVICSHIKEEIRANQITGGLLGIYNPSITQRLNGLVDRVETDNVHKVKKFEVEILKSNNEDTEQ